MKINNNSFKQKLFSGIIWRSLNVLCSFFFNALLVNQLGAGKTGIFFYLLNNLFFLALLLGIGLESGISYYNARKEISPSYLFSISIVWSTLSAFIFFIIVYFTPINLHLDKNIFSFTLYIFGSMLTSFLSSFFFTKHDSKTPNLIATITIIILIVLLPKMPWISGKISFELYINIYLLSPLFSGIILMAIMLGQKIVFTFKSLQYSVVKPLLIFSVHSFIINLLFNLLKRSDFWLVNKWCSQNDAGNYFQASKVIQLVLLLPALASFSLYPLIVQSIKKNETDKNVKEAEKKVLQLVGLYFFMAILFSLGIFCFGFWLFKFLYGSSFNHLYLITLFLIPGLIFFAASYPLSIYFSGKNKNIITMVFLLISIIVLFLSNLVLTPKYLIYGAAISNSLSNIIYFVLMTKRFFSVNKLPFNLNYFIFPVKAKEILKAF